MSSISSVRRILVALDASPDSLAALEAAAHVAASLGAELTGLYVEDEVLIRSAELPLSSVVGSFSGAVHRIGRSELERQLRAQARRARTAFETVAARVRVRRSFRVVRGSVTSTLREASGEVDLISLGRCGWAPGSRRMGHTATTLLEREGAPVLLLDRGLRPGQAVVAIYDGGEDSVAALDFACMLSRNGQTPLSVVFRGPDDQLEALEHAARARLSERGVDRGVQFFRLGTGDASRLVQLRRMGGIGILVLPRAHALGKSIANLLTELRCPVLVMRKPPEAQRS